MKHKNWIAILDFGSQYTHLIARRVRECGVYSEIVPYAITAERLAARKPTGIILSGGPSSVTSRKSPLCDRGLFKLGIPILGICYGAQLIAKSFGGKVAASKKREYGSAMLKIRSRGSLFKNLKISEKVWMSHGDKIIKVPKGFAALASTSASPVAAMENKHFKVFGVQFHPEVAHTPNGKKIVYNFVRRISACPRSWDMRSFVKNAIDDIKQLVGKEKVLCALSGGVDSSVLATLLSKAIGKRLIAMFIDNGLLRKNERRAVEKRFKQHYRINLKTVDASGLFLKALRRVKDPERKRKVIGKTFIDVFAKESKKLGRIKFLAQGTLYPDVIESRSAFGGPSATIKTHHNVGGLPKKMKFELVEPFKELFKDEVRLVGKELGLPDEIVYRQPFPGPGLAVRIIGSVTTGRLKILRESDSIFIEESKRAHVYENVWQSFCVLLPVKTVGVMGDERTYEHTIVIRAVTSADGMTADWARLPYEFLKNVSNRIVNEVKGVNRVVYDISSKPPATIEWE